jgi:hypothetical protein
MRLLTILLWLAACDAAIANARVPAPTCLRRDVSHDDLCKQGAWNGRGDETEYYTWRFDVCKDGLPRNDDERRDALGRCVAIGPHIAFNLINWCCPPSAQPFDELALAERLVDLAEL